MFGPLGTGLGAALGAGIGGVTNWLGGQQKEKDDKKQAMRELYNRFLSGGDMMQFKQPVQQAPTLAESVGKPLLGAGLEAMTAKPPKPGEVQPEWYEQAAKGYLGATR